MVMMRGDKVLIQLAQIFISSVRVQDNLGRWGGEEFITQD